MSYLTKKQGEVDSKRIQPDRATWKQSRSTKAMLGVFNTLKNMAGAGNRCMYCSNSEGNQIDHFYPMSHYSEKMFSWENMILACSICNLQKLEKFELDDNNNPLLIDPTNEDPWSNLYLDLDTGNIVAQYLDGGYSPRGEYTSSEDTLPLNTEANCDCRLKAIKTILKAISEYNTKPGSNKSLNSLKKTILANNGQDVAYWIFCASKEKHPTLKALNLKHPKAERYIQEALNPDGTS